MPDTGFFISIPVTKVLHL